ncbi:MAG: glycosyltransferase family 4 protein, partial [Bdellovibrionales bacterium]|nr:glycosyltransferase family 4 protein [Bdellovibrionales bacterium]
PAKWDVPRNEGIYQLLKNDPAVHVLHVGRLAPNKKIEDIIKVFYYLTKISEAPAKLWLVGHDIDTELYSFALKRLVRELDIVDAVNFVGRRDDTEVRALYEASEIYLCMSEHEGFCCPVIEAMHFGLPVIAYAATALPDTVGDAAILVKEKRYPEIAEIINQLHLDHQLRERLIAAGHQRVAALSFQGFERRVSQIFFPLNAGKIDPRQISAS